MLMTGEWPSEVYSAAQTREIDSAIIAAGTSGFELMQRAAEALWTLTLARWPDLRSMTVLCGGGNNGGDGFLVARLALRAGWQVRVLTVFSTEALRGDAREAWQAALACGVDVQPWRPDSVLNGVVVDALLGTGLEGCVRAPFAAAIDMINASGLPVVAVDIPSGLHADTGVALGVAVQADMTVTFITLKPGLLTGQGPDRVGTLHYAALARLPAGSPAPVLERLVPEVWLGRLPSRPKAAHKGLFGHVLLIGGDHGMGGAIILAAEAALRSGAGRVSVATRPEHVSALLSRCPEVMALGVETAGQMTERVAAADVLVIGPGLGRSAWSRALLQLALEAGVSRVLDADALTLLAERPAGSVTLGKSDVITPHPAEAARLLGCSTAEVQADRLHALQSLVERFGCAVVLKGVGSLVGGGDEKVQSPSICTSGCPAMATAGMGDVLSGLVAALLAQGMEAGAAARYAVLVHALAGEMAAGEDERGVLAGDLMMPIRHWLNVRGMT